VKLKLKLMIAIIMMELYVKVDQRIIKNKLNLIIDYTWIWVVKWKYKKITWYKILKIKNKIKRANNYGKLFWKFIFRKWCKTRNNQ